AATDTSVVAVVIMALFTSKILILTICPTVPLVGAIENGASRFAVPPVMVASNTPLYIGFPSIQVSPVFTMMVVLKLSPYALSISFIRVVDAIDIALVTSSEIAIGEVSTLVANDE